MATRLRALIGAARRRLADRQLDREQLRRRALAFAGLWILLGGMLVVLGFGSVVVAASAVAVAIGVTALAIWLLLRLGLGDAVRSARAWVRRAASALEHGLEQLDLRRRLQAAAGGVAAVARRALRALRARAPVVRAAAVAAAVGGVRHARLVAGLGRRSYQTASAHLAVLAREARTAGSGISASLPVAKPPSQERRRDALRLNARGGQLRRTGEHAQAAEQHRAALAIVRDLGDKRLEALTLNDLALALIHTEGAAAAVDHLEQALAVLRELGDDEHEGRVTANLAFARRRQGRSEEADDLLHAALTKLAPDSSAYRRVEEQLRRAS